MSTRRDFLTAATVFSIVPRHVLGRSGYTPPSEMVTVGLVGAGGRGFQNAKELMKLDDVRITAIADPAEHWDLSKFYCRGVAGRKPVASLRFSIRNWKLRLRRLGRLSNEATAIIAIGLTPRRVGRRRVPTSGSEPT